MIMATLLPSLTLVLMLVGLFKLSFVPFGVADSFCCKVDVAFSCISNATVKGMLGMFMECVL